MTTDQFMGSVYSSFHFNTFILGYANYYFLQLFSEIIILK